VNDPSRLSDQRIQVVDRTTNILCYTDTRNDIDDCVLTAVQEAPPGPLTVVIDSADTLSADLGSAVKAYNIFNSLLIFLRSRSAPTRLIIHLNLPSPIRHLLLSTKLSSSLTHIIAHPPQLIAHVATVHLALPPPNTQSDRFWKVFSPIAARSWEVEKLTYGAEGAGSSSRYDEVVLEVLVRSPSSAFGDGRRRGAERTLEGWSRVSGSCELTELESLRFALGYSAVKERTAPDPTRNLPFNLNLTPNQHQARSMVPLPYTPENNIIDSSIVAGSIYYDPESADDMDDEDPDEDLDI